MTSIAYRLRQYKFKLIIIAFLSLQPLEKRRDTRIAAIIRIGLRLCVTRLSALISLRSRGIVSGRNEAAAYEIIARSDSALSL